jgi:hypothetical protein
MQQLFEQSARLKAQGKFDAKCINKSSWKHGQHAGRKPKTKNVGFN